MTIRTRSSRRLCAALLAVGTLPVLADVSMADLEAQVWTATVFNDGCSGDPLPGSAEFVSKWYDEITDHPGWIRDHKQVNDTIRSNRFCDPDSDLAQLEGVPCNDASHLDDADAAFIVFHGGDWDGWWTMRVRSEFMNECDVGHGPGDWGFPEALLLGDSDLEFLHVDSCHSMDDDNLHNTWRMFRDPVDSPVTGGRLHVATGFHGLSSDACPNCVKRFAEDAFTVPISDAWLDNRYRGSLTVDGLTREQCPVAYSVGDDSNDCNRRLGSENYADIQGEPGSTDWACWDGFQDCHPFDEDLFD